ncbi:MAG: cytochrome c biogenesis protein ResB [Lachnospiraceae bacterium]|nr:cytochrome c biogenesis protein ResB [Lachnospiraceae bacterium]
MLKKAWNFLSSMRFAVILLLVLIAACAAGSFVTQGQTLAWYTQTYSERTAALIMALHLDDVFHSLWFIVLTAFLCLNLLLCNVLRLPSLIRKWKSAGSARTVRAHRAEAACRGEKDPDGLFQRLGFRHVEKDGDFRFGIKNRAGIWGAWVCHLGILLVILGFGLGQSFKEEYTVYGVPGQSRQIGDTSYILTIDAFDVDLREDETVRQYAADITVRNASDGTSASGTAAVNAPLTMFGMKFYQNSTGWACDMKVEKDGEEIQKETVCAGDYLAIKDKPDLLVLFNVFYPDYVMDPENGPMTASSELKNPAYLYSAYYQGRMLGMNALTGDEVLTIDEYTITFENPRNYTLIQVKKDPFTPLALIGGLVTLIGLILAFYVQPAWIRAEKNGDEWITEAGSRKGGALFTEHFAEEAEKEGMTPVQKEADAVPADSQPEDAAEQAKTE